MIREIPGELLLIGNALDARSQVPLFELQIAAVVDLAINEPPAVPPREIIYCRFPLVDGAENSPHRLEAAIRCVTMLLRERFRTLVACSAGMSRAPAIASAALALTSGRSLDACLAAVVAGSPSDLSPALWGEVNAVYRRIVEVPT